MFVFSFPESNPLGGVGGPALLGEPHFALRAEEEEGFAVAWGKAHGKFAQFGAAAFRADERLDHEGVGATVGDPIREALQLAWLQIANVGRDSGGDFGDFLVAVRVEVREPR